MPEHNPLVDFCTQFVTEFAKENRQLFSEHSNPRFNSLNLLQKTYEQRRKIVARTLAEMHTVED
jgi:hypothetical protein